MLVDCHVHLNNYTTRRVPTEENLRRLLTRMRRYRIDHALVLSSYMINENRPSAETVADLCAPHPNLSVVEGILFDDGRPGDLDGTRERLEAGKVVGLKMYPGYLPFYPNDPACEPVYELAMEFDVPVMFHAGDTYAKGAKVKFSHPLVLDDVAVDHPELTMIICHLGNPWFRDTAELLYKNENCYADISGLVLAGTEYALERWIAEDVREIIEYAGDPEHLLYGTDWPLVRMKPYLHFLEGLDMPKRAKEKVHWRNADRLFKLNLKERARKRPTATPRPDSATGRGKARRGGRR